MTRWAWYAVAVLGAAAGASGCGSGSSAVGAPDATAGNDGPTVGDDGDAARPEGSTGAPDGGGGMAASRCPASPPANGAACTGAGPCTYADDPRPACRTLAVCAPPSCSCGSDTCLPGQCPDAGSAWSVGSHWASQCVPSCPATAVTEGAPCSQLYAYCPLADGTPCGCFASDGGTRWTCFNPVTDPQCPKIAPPLGTPCTQEGLACGTYDVCVTGARVVCRGAVWVDNVGSCPN